ncbi:MAG: APC family permease [Planctomycetales bacterium]|nr:APC family permease [Planctomycetales bacterium]
MDASAPQTTPPAVQEIKGSEVAPEDSLHISSAVKSILVGKPLDLTDRSIYHHVSLVAFLAWVGLGADGLSSSCYGPSEAFHHLGTHHHLAIFLAIATIFTVFVISACYSHIIEAFPSGGGGYLVASKLLGRPVGVISGCALVVDYILTVTVSIAAAGDALLGLAGPEWAHWKLPLETGAIVVLVLLNLRGVKESVTVLLPIFLLFLATHAVLITGSIALHVGSLGTVTQDIATEVRADLANPSMGLFGTVGLLLYAYSLGAGTYTGIEAVSNSMPVMREPRVATAQRTMIYMATSLAVTAGGLMLAYLLLKLALPEGATITMNQLLSEKFVTGLGMSPWAARTFVLVTMLSEGALLVVAAQAGFIDGPRVLANMAHDSYVPHRFGSLSDRLAAHNGIFLIGGAALLALWGTRGNITTLVSMYSINVFLTFSLSMIGMCRFWLKQKVNPLRRRRLLLFGFGAAMCLTILGVTIWFKLLNGGLVTVGVTGLFVVACFLVHWYYRAVSRRLEGLTSSLGAIEVNQEPNLAPPKADLPTAIVLVGGYSGLGVHTLLGALQKVPRHFQNVIFISVGVVDSGNFTGADAVDDVRDYTIFNLQKYVDLARRMGLPSRGYLSIGTDVVAELENLCKTIHKEFPKSIVIAGQLVFRRETWIGLLLHNQTAFSLERRLQWDGIPMMILPTRVQ